MIDLLVKAGYGEAVAAQLIMRKLLAAGVAPPRQGSDARGWKRLLLWAGRSELRLGLGRGQDRVSGLAHELETIPAVERVRRVLDEQLWDCRRKRR